jgi:hypothetical protein
LSPAVVLVAQWLVACAKVAEEEPVVYYLEMFYYKMAQFIRYKWVLAVLVLLATKATTAPILQFLEQV